MFESDGNNINDSDNSFNLTYHRPVDAASAVTAVARPTAAANTTNSSGSVLSISSASEVKANNSITITTGTGAELAAAVKNIRITQRQERHQQQQQQPQQQRTTSSSSLVQEVIADDDYHLNEAPYSHDEQEQGDIGHGQEIHDEEENEAKVSEIAMTTSVVEEDAEAQAKFFAQRFQTEWRICLKRATVDFDRAMKLFWCEVRIVTRAAGRELFIFSIIILFGYAHRSIFISHNPPSPPSPTKSLVGRSLLE